MHNLPINRGIPPIIPYVIASFYLFPYCSCNKEPNLQLRV
jgi:hypothetical protein